MADYKQLKTIDLLNSIDKSWQEVLDLTIYDAAFWMEIGNDPIAHKYQCQCDSKYEEYYLDHPGGFDAVNKKSTVLLSAIRSGEIGITKSLVTQDSFDINNTYISKADWIKWCKNHDYVNLSNLFSPDLNIYRRSTGALSNEDEFAKLFDPVTVEVLEKMFPADRNWKVWAERAKRNGLIKARVGRAKFNPYKAAQWFLTQNITGYDMARCNRILANNLPARSKDNEHLLTGDFT